jgi:crotonobetainyl-CoA:carnitine CoA-transferase CaiB-like acyl-CoA transferase
VVEGFRPGVAERLGIEFPRLSTGNPRLIYCSISGFGQGVSFAISPGTI